MDGDDEAGRVPPVSVDLSVAAEDHLKAIWKATEWDGAPATTGGLAEILGTTPASVSDMVRRLAEKGLLEHRPYKPVTLTDAGRAAAVRVVRRHRILETFLVAELGYRWDEVHDDAEALEHWISDRLLARLDAKLGHPVTDPHGDPIPHPDGTVPRPGVVVRLGDADTGEYTVVRLSDDDPGRLRWCSERGLVPGARVTVVRDRQAGTVRVSGADVGGVVDLGSGMAGTVLLEPRRVPDP